LWDEDGLPTSSIGEKLQQVGGTLTGVLDRMEERGLIRRERDIDDRRIWRIWLTEEGKRLETVLPPIGVEIRANNEGNITCSAGTILAIGRSGDRQSVLAIPRIDLKTIPPGWCLLMLRAVKLIIRMLNN
jgi:DNA-binding MarR family transcriptional regulator